MRVVTIRQALQNVADFPEMVDDEILQRPVYELVARSLYDIANRPDATVRGSMGKANRARKMILDRLVGKRRAGSHPATREVVQVEFVDLINREVSDEPAAEVQPADG